MERRDVEDRAAARGTIRVVVALAALAALVAAGGCSESLFGARAASGGDGSVPDRCDTHCLGDAGATFATSDHGGFRYVDDLRATAWTAMQDRDGAAVGAGANRIEPCASGEPACAGLGSALRVTSTGSTGAADPAILFEPPAPAVVQLVVRVRVPAGGQGHRVRAYRNSREDALFTLTAQPGELVERTVSAALISEDRFGVALEPLAAGGVVGVELFVIDPRASLPAACTLALSFNDPTLTGSVISDGCGTRHFTYLDGATPVAAITVRAPYAGLGQALYLESQLHATGRGALLGGARTIQLWLHQTSTPIRRAWVFSDLDAAGAGLGLRYTGTGQLEAVVGTAAAESSHAIALPTAEAWHFVRVAHAAGTVTWCLDGKPAGSGPLPGPATSSLPPAVGQGRGVDTDALVGEIDDLRVLPGALPCE